MCSAASRCRPCGAWRRGTSRRRCARGCAPAPGGQLGTTRTRAIRGAPPTGLIRGARDAGTRRREDPDRDAVADGSRPHDGERIDSAYAAALSRALGDSGQGEAPEDDYGSALSALERHETDAHRPSYSESTAMPGVGSGSIGGSHESDCQEDVTPTCRQVAATVESRVASIRTRLDAGGLSMSETYDLGAEMYKVFLDHLPACYATETRPHCRALNEQDLQQFRHAYESARESARQARGG